MQVGDLGLACVLPSSAALASSTSSLIGPVQWMSPEAHRGDYSRASDVYMFGTTLLELVTRRAPFTGKLQPCHINDAADADTPLNLVGGLVDSGKRPQRPSAAVCP